MDNMDLNKVGAVILAGGFGTRIRDLYPSVPKPMIEVCGLPFIEWVIRYLASNGISTFCLSLGHKAEVVEDYLKRRPDDGLNISSVREEVPLGTAGGFLLSSKKMEDKEFLLVANGDSIVLANLSPAFEVLQESLQEAVIIGITMEDCSRYGSLECSADGKLLHFNEKKPGAGIINAGIYIFRKKSLDDFPRKNPLSFEYDVFPEFLNIGKKILVMETKAPFIDIGTPETVRRAEAFIKKHREDIYFHKGGLLR